MSRQLSFLDDMLWTMPSRLSLPHQTACWYCRPMSLWRIGLAPPGILAASLSSSSACWAMFGLSEVDQATISLVQRS